MMEENSSSTVLEAEIIGIRFALATNEEICIASINDSPISHVSQLSNPFLGLPLEFGKCESCGTSEPGKCEGHFGYIKLPVPIYHPSHVSDLKRMLTFLCLNCLKMKNNKVSGSSNGIAQRLLSSCCDNTTQVSVKEIKTSDAWYLELKQHSRNKQPCWSFLDKYGFCYGHNFTRTLLPCEVKEIIRRIPAETKRKLARKGCFPQDGYVLEYLPVPPNCLSIPEVSDGISILSSDPSITMLKKVLKKVEIINSSRSGTPNFESHEVEANDLQSVVNQYLQIRGTGKTSRDIDSHFGLSKELNSSSTKAWLEKMRTLFIRKGSGFSSRSVITGDAYTQVSEIGVPAEVARRITFEERVNVHNMRYLQKLVDQNCCLTYKEGFTTYSLREGSKGHTNLRLGQIVHRRIMNGDIVFVNRPPTTHKHSLQALKVYIHDGHTVKINPLICGPLSADFDGDCVHLFYPQSLAAKAEVLELFSVEKQLLSSHTGNLNLQLANDSLLSLKRLFKTYFLDRKAAQQLAMFVSSSLPRPALLMAYSAGPFWTGLQMFQSALPPSFDCSGDQFVIEKSEFLKFEFSGDLVAPLLNEIVTSIFFSKGPAEALKFFDVLQPFLMENIFAQGFSISLEDFYISNAAIRSIDKSIHTFFYLLYNLRSAYNELLEQQLDNHIRAVKLPVKKFILNSSAFGELVDSKSDSAINKVVQQIGFLGLQLSDHGKFYTKSLIEDMGSLYHHKYRFNKEGYPTAEYGFIKGCFFRGLDPFEEMVHSISTREVIIRSSRGLSEPGTLFKNLMAILRDVVICYDGTIRNLCSNSIIQFDYGMNNGDMTQSLFPPGEPVGVLAATAMSTPAYKAVLDASPSSNCSWGLMKEILLCKAGFRNEPFDRRVILYLNDCVCGRKFCRENAACSVQNQLKKLSLKDIAVDFMIEYRVHQTVSEGSENEAGLVGHIHLSEVMIKKNKISMPHILQKCEERIKAFHKKKRVGLVFKRTVLYLSECCSFEQSFKPCIMFNWQDASDTNLDRISNILVDLIYPVLLETIVKGDLRIFSSSIIWVSPDSTTCIRHPYRPPRGELALDVILEKTAVKRSGDAWRTVLDCCLPVLHLIDTRRSIPYSIKQVQELLGISCAFDQAIQRLARSVSMVTKGVHKEHLILLANSMTCSGNFLGFNTGGYKALSSSLNVQVPFTEATLYTPKKCFERAAVKRHMDTLSSLVGSCSWGKHVSVGTGSRFDILLDKQQSALGEGDIGDIYSFLDTVRSGTAVAADSACLGDDIDELEEADWVMSPEHDFEFAEKLEFEDSLDVGESNWEKDSSPPACSRGGDWIANNKSVNDTPKQNGWSGWASEDVKKKSILAAMSEEDSWRWNTSQKSKAQQDSSGEGSQKKLSKEANFPGWNSPNTGGNSNVDYLGEQQDNGSLKSWEESSRWDEKVSDRKKTNSTSGWGSSQASRNESNKLQISDSEIAEDHSQNNKDSLWEQQSSENSRGWGFRNSGADSQTGGNNLSIKQNRESYKRKHSEGSGGWEDWKNKNQPPKLPAAMAKDDSSTDVISWSWNTSQKSKAQEDSPGWGSQKKSSKEASFPGWDSTKMGGNSDTDHQGGQQDNGSLKSWEENSRWDEKVSDRKKIESTSDWGSSQTSRNESNMLPISDSDIAENHSQNKKDSFWERQSSENSQGWGSGNSGANSQTRGNNPWVKQNRESFKKKHSEGSGGWGSNTDDSKNKNHLPKSPAAMAEDVSSIDVISRCWNTSQKSKAQDDSPGWGSQKKLSKEASFPRWDSTKTGSNSGIDHLGGQQDNGSLNSREESSRWDEKDTDRKKSESTSVWGSSQIIRNESNKLQILDSEIADHSQNSEDSLLEHQSSENSQGWGSRNSGANSQTGGNNPWVKQNRESFKRKHSEGSGGWGSNTKDWKNKNRPPKSPAMAKDDSCTAAIYTATRQRLDMFTSEEQDALKEIDPIMQSIRRIMRQASDGEPLSVDDQSFIIENVLNHHPDKAAKMGSAIDHVMVSKHRNFTDTRCFYVVQSDGKQEDFSYRKCLNNLIKDKYPDVAEQFIEKYFSRSRPVQNREQRPVPKDCGSKRDKNTDSEEDKRSKYLFSIPDDSCGEREQNSTSEDHGVSQEKNTTPKKSSWSRDPTSESPGWSWNQNTPEEPDCSSPGKNNTGEKPGWGRKQNTTLQEQSWSQEKNTSPEKSGRSMVQNPTSENPGWSWNQNTPEEPSYWTQGKNNTADEPSWDRKQDTT